MALAVPAPSAAAIHLQESGSAEIVRPLANFPPSAWGNFFIDYVQDEAKLEQWRQRSVGLKEEVRQLMSDARGREHEVFVVDVVKRVGLEYPFEAEIDDALSRLYGAYLNGGYFDGDDLYLTAYKFRVMREGGYKVSPDVFDKFKDGRGELDESLTADVKGLLSLYEAAFLGIQGEDVLDEAIAFTTKHLKSTLPSLDPSFRKEVEKALDMPAHKRLPRINARYFINLYDQIESKFFDGMEKVIELAKLDYNLVQALHQQEIKAVSQWWKEKQLAQKLSYARDRAVECYAWNMNVAPDPRFSQSRIFGAKLLSMISMTDDTYDAYGVYDELKKYTEAVDKWDRAAMDDLPDYMKILYSEIMTHFEETKKELEKEGYAYQLDYMKKAYKELCRCYFTEAEWYHNRYTPGTEEYIRVSLITCGYPTVFLLTAICMKEASKETFEWWDTRPRIVMASAEICRFIDDLVSNKFEQERGHVVSGIECFIKEKGMTEEEVRTLFKQFYHTAWKDINEACLHPRVFPMYILSKAVNLARVIDIWYNNNDTDEYTFSGGRTKEMIASLLVDPIPV